MRRLWDYIKSLFSKSYEKPSVPSGGYDETPVFKGKWGYIVPHVQNAQGAVTPDRKTSEYKFGIKVAIINNSVFPSETRDEGGVYGATKRLVKRGVSCTWEDHKNAYNGKVGGAEILYIKGDTTSKEVAENILEAFKNKFPDRKIRGAKAMSSGGRGYNNLRDAKRAGSKVTLLGELFFIDNKSDWLSEELIAEFLREALV